MAKIEPIRICGKSLTYFPVNTDEVNQALFADIQNGDKLARDKIILGNLRLIVLAIRRYIFIEEDTQDLFQVGVVGLIKAVDNFDSTRGTAFSTYAVAMIAGELRLYIRENHSIRVARSLRDIAYRARSHAEHIRKKTGRELTVQELAELMEVPEKRIVEALTAQQAVVSIDSEIAESHNREMVLSDVLRDEAVTEDVWIENLSLQMALTKLDDRARKIIWLRYAKNKSQQEVARLLDTSQPQVSRIEKRALIALKKYMQA